MSAHLCTESRAPGCVGACGEELTLLVLMMDLGLLGARVVGLSSCNCCTRKSSGMQSNLPVYLDQDVEDLE